MSGNYQAVYDAVRSCFSFCNPGQIIAEHCHLDASFQIEQLKQEYLIPAWEMARPSTIYRPELEQKSGRWIAHYGDCEGIADSPYDAMEAFDTAWREKINA